MFGRFNSKRQKELNEKLNTAILRENKAKIEKYCKKGANINGEFKTGEGTVLELALYTNNLIIIQTLLEQGAKVDQLTRNKGSSTLHRMTREVNAQCKCAQEKLDLLLEYDFKNSFMNLKDKNVRTPYDWLKSELQDSYRKKVKEIQAQMPREKTSAWKGAVLYPFQTCGFFPSPTVEDSSSSEIELRSMGSIKLKKE